jgi:hypothetical protein
MAEVTSGNVTILILTHREALALANSLALEVLEGDESDSDLPYLRAINDALVG